jgi:hypothetical protein
VRVWSEALGLEVRCHLFYEFVALSLGLLLLVGHLGSLGPDSNNDAGVCLSQAGTATTLSGKIH